MPPLDSSLRIHEIEMLTGRHRTTIQRWVNAGLFPENLKTRHVPVGWRRSEVERWLAGSWTSRTTSTLQPQRPRRAPCQL
jgi:predicted DNA-binding transcriptional regulator AlpA